MKPPSPTQATGSPELSPRTETLFDLVEEAVVVVGSDRSIQEWDNGAARIFGWSREEALGMPVSLLQAAGAARGPASAVQQAHVNKSQWHGEVRFARKSGGTGWCEVVAIPDAENRATLSIRDVTARRRRLERISEEHHLLRTLMDGIPDVIVLKDTDGRYIMRNQAHRKLTGRPDEQVLGLTSAEIRFPPALATSYFEDNTAVLQTGQAVVNREEEFEFSDGRKGWFLTSKFPLRDAAGQVIGVIALARDITELKRAADELAETRQRLSLHLDNSLLLVAELDPAFRITRWAGRAEKMFGWTASEAIGRTIDELQATHPDDAPRVQELLARLVEGKEDHNISRNRNLTKNGGVIHCLWWNSVLRDSAGRPRSFLMLAEDITYTVQTLEKLQDSDRLLGILIDATNTGYVLLDGEGRILAVNEKYLHFFGFTQPEAMVGRLCMDFVAPVHREAAVLEFERLRTEGKARNLELELCGAGGRTSYFEFNAKVEDTKGGLRFHGFLRDISNRRRAVEERLAIEAKLQEAQKLESLGLMAGGIAHDFNNLLTGVLGNASMATSELPPESPVRSYLEQIEKSAARAAELCRQMLAYSGRGRFDVKNVGVNGLIQETMDLLMLSISKRTRLEFHLGRELPPVLADPTQLRQIVMNLAINASESIGEQDGTVTISTGTCWLDSKSLSECHASPDASEGDYVWFEVRDNGCGMESEVLGRIFDPFFTTKFTGRGLGLAAVLGIVRSHRGALTVRSKAGRGTEFRIFLPVSEQKGADVGAESSATPETWRGTGTVLLVDDEETVRKVASRMLQHLGFRVTVAVDGVEALKILQGLEDLRFVFLDLTMPRMDGRETFLAMRALKPDTRFLIMSGFSEENAADRFSGERSVAFVEKPFNLPQLQDKVRKLLE